jgi:hypothetical protein
MTLLDAKEYDPAKSRKRTQRIVLGITILVIVLALGWWFRYWPQEHVVGKFFEGLQKQDYKTAYGIWMNDPQWAQHPEQHPKYPFNEFHPGAGKWRGRRCNRERPFRARSGLGGEIGPHAQLPALRIAVSLACTDAQSCER